MKIKWSSFINDWMGQHGVTQQLSLTVSAGVGSCENRRIQCAHVWYSDYHGGWRVALQDMKRGMVSRFWTVATLNEAVEIAEQYCIQLLLSGVEA